VRSGPVRVSVVRRRFDGPRTVVARTRRRPARQTRCERTLRARSRVSEVRLVAPAGVATGDASDRLLHSETVPTRALVPRRFPAQQPRPDDAFRRSSEGHSRPGASRLRARPRERLFRAPRRPSEDRRSGHREARGRPMRTRPGRIALHDAAPTSAPGRSSRGGVLFRRVKVEIPVASDTLVASSSPLCGRFFPAPAHGLEGRQDWFRGGLVKGVRMTSPGCLPPTDTTHIPLAKHETKLRCLQRRRGVHVMRIAELRCHAPLLPPVSPCAYAPERPDGQAPVHALRVAAGLSTRWRPVARFSEPEGVPPTSAIRRRTGTHRELLRFLVQRGEVTTLSAPCLRLPPRGDSAG
jgi:hypothetical protein